MADDDWKKRVGIDINYSSGEEDEEVNSYRYKNLSPETVLSLESGGLALRLTSTDELLSQYEQYGSTPPRTKIKNKNRDWGGRQKMDSSSVKMRSGCGGRLARPRADRRNTVDCAILNQMIIEPSIEEKARTDKRSTQLLRESERDIKMSIVVNTVAQRTQYNRASGSYEERAESMPSQQNGATPANPTLIESHNRFMSVKSRPVGCRTSAPPSSFLNFKDTPVHNTIADVPQNRLDFHETFSNLIKLGSVDKQDRNSKNVISSEERIWQTEVNDLIWLELQAWHADRTLEQQDNFLCTARQTISDLIRDIMSYRFKRELARSDSNISGNDSGIVSATDSASSVQDEKYMAFCFGCLSMYCNDCLQVQSVAMKQVETLLTRLEVAESLFPSTKSLGITFPVYKSKEFVGRVKAMCLWYNMTKQHRLKLLILGKLLARLQGTSKHYQWPITETDSSTSSSVPEHSANESSDIKQTERLRKVQFIDESSATESANSDESATNTSQKDYPDESKFPCNVNLYNLDPMMQVTTQSSELYRKYIENVLKSRGLGMSLSFLHRLHNVVLRKAHITLEHPEREDADEYELDVFDDEDVPIIEPPLEKEQEEELKRYGYWSTEAKELGLPSYISAFIFLSLIPLEVIHEFLKMRLETKPLKPNVLSLEQLIKELKEGLTLAMIHRERFKKHISTALYDRDNDMERYVGVLDAFDVSVKKVFELYLDYAEQWVVVATPEGHRKSALDEEWRFTKLVCPMIPGEHPLAARKFCNIIERLLDHIGSRLKTRADDLDSQTLIFEENSTKGESAKWQLLTICRETQQLFTTEREKCIKIMAFAKTLFRDIENNDFHRDHNEDNVHLRNNSSFVCEPVVESVRLLKRNVILFRDKLTSTIERVQHRCDVKHMADMDDIDKQAVLSRTREILHQGYKFGFEYHKDLCRLYETKIYNCKDSQCESKLSTAIIGFAKLWMKFVMERCERGRGVRPRWAAQGLDFLISACDPINTNNLSTSEFEDLKSKIDACISHVIGSDKQPVNIRKSPRSRKSSPSPNKNPRSSIPTLNIPKSFLNQYSLREDLMVRTASPLLSEDQPDFLRKQSYEPARQISITVPENSFTPVLREVRIRDAVNRLDLELENDLRDRNLIGNVKELSSCDKVLKRARSVNFSWHRGIKIGQGRFGKVYTAVNNSNGELLAMKEITIQPGETRAIKRVAEELKIFEGISHRHLVKYHGVEIHREELLIFMELCSEGTLESLVELSGGLYEVQTRRFTAQLLSAVVELHKNGVVHRDIKTANIFLTSDGNCLKLGDFGSAVKIQAHTTLPGELKGYVGTQAYMAPEVFTKTNTEGHGRAADIWSLGCVVIEMCSGKRPWYQFDSNFQIMFKVGMGETPEIPESLSQEGQEFVANCLQHDPKMRQAATELLQHNFCKVDVDDCKCCESEKEVRRSLRRNYKSK